jgi:hypothetical protein
MGRRSLAGLTEHAGIKCGTPSTFPETLMKFVIGVALIVIAVGMVLLARPRDGESAPYLRIYIVGQLYILTALIGMVMGTALMIVNWPI